MYQTPKPTKPKHWSAPKLALTLIATAIAVTTTIIIGSRLTDQALAVLAGATCGVTAAIPTSLLIIAVSRRQKREEPAPQPQYAPMTRPIVMVTPPVAMPQQQQLSQSPFYNTPHTRPPRTFHVVGAPGEMEEEEYEQ